MLITKIYTKDTLDKAAQELRLGELVSFPTETVYGLGADATNAQAVKRVYLAKGRPSDNPLIVTVSSIDMIKQFVPNINEWGQKLMKRFWPGPLTMIFKIKNGSLPDVVTGGLETAAFRMPDNQVTLDLISKVGHPLVGPSANSSGKPSPTTAQHVYHDLEGRIAGIVDDGPANYGVESTIVDLSSDQPTVLRPGAIIPEQIEKVLGIEVVSDKHHVKSSEVPKAPGMKYKHYAPDAQVIIINTNQWSEALIWAENIKQPIGIMATDDMQETLPNNCEFFSLGTDVTTASHKLFDGLRYFDDKKQVKYILVQAFSEEGLGAAYMNRLKKSAGDTFFDK